MIHFWTEQKHVNKESSNTRLFLLSFLLRNMDCFHCIALSLVLRLSTSSSLFCSSISWKAFLVLMLTMMGLGSELVLSAFSMDTT